MRIIILSINYWPEETGIGVFTTYRAEYLAAAGHDVEVYTTFPYYPQWKVPSCYANKLAVSEERNGVRILRSYSYVPNPVTPLKRVLHEASYTATCLLRAIARKRPDILFVVSPPLGLAANAFVLSRLWRVPYVFDVQDLQPDSAAELSMLPSWALKVLYRIEHAAYRYASLISTLTNGMQARIVGKGIPSEKLVLFEPRADESLSSIAPTEGNDFRHRYDLDNKFLVVHSGNMGVKQGLDVIVNAAALNRSDNSMLFLLVGDGSAGKSIRQQAAKLELQNVRFLPVLDSEEFRGLLAASDICLLTQHKASCECAFPSKLVTYLTAGRPVVASVNHNSEAAQAIFESGAGEVVACDNANSLLEAITRIRKSDLQEYGKHAREYACRKWSPERVLRQFERTLIAVAAPETRSSVQEGTIQ